MMETFQRLVNEVQLKASLQEIKRIEKFSTELRSFMAFIEGMKRKQANP